jgi:hypothetical protein
MSITVDHRKISFPETNSRRHRFCGFRKPTHGVGFAFGPCPATAHAVSERSSGKTSKELNLP